MHYATSPSRSARNIQNDRALAGGSGGLAERSPQKVVHAARGSTAAPAKQSPTIPDTSASGPPSEAYRLEIGCIRGPARDPARADESEPNRQATAKVDTSPLTIDEVRQYLEELGLDDCRRANRTIFDRWIRRERWDAVEGIPSESQWRTALVGAVMPDNEWTRERDLAGKRLNPYCLAPRDLEKVRYTVIDCDLHSVDEELDEMLHDLHERDPLGWRRFIRDRLAPSRWRRRRVAERLGQVVEALRLKFPGASYSVHGTPRGLHVVLKLDRAYRVRRARAIGLAMLDVIRAHLDDDVADRLEVFPTQHGTHCRAPCTGPSRVLSDDLRTRAYSRRAADVRHVIAMRPNSLDDLGLDLETVRDHERELRNRRRKDERIERERFDATEGKLHGSEFVEEVERFLSDGIGDDQSWDFTRRFAFYARLRHDLDPGQCETAFVRFLEQPIHASDRCATPQGRRQLVGSLRSALRYYEDGITAGSLTPAGVPPSGALLDLLPELARAAA